MSQKLDVGRSPEPLVKKNDFREQTVVTRSVPSFLEVKSRLPVPVLPEHPQWVELYWRTWELAWFHLSRPARLSGLVASYSATPDNDHLVLWDSVFVTQFGVYGRFAFDFLGTLDNFYAKQHDDGFICREIACESGQDRFQTFDPIGAGPNIMAWAEWRSYRMTGVDSRLSRVFWPLMGLHRWHRNYRTWQSGLYWTTGHSSGMTNQPRVPDSKFHHRHWAWVDASMQAAVDCDRLHRMATLLNELDLVKELAQERAGLRQQINAGLWNAEAGFYQDVSANGRFSPVKSVGAYWGLLDNGCIPSDRKQAFIQHLRDRWAFELPHRIPSQSADSEGYNASTGNRWRGAVWPATNFMVLKGLREAGVVRLAHEIAVNHLTHVNEVFERTDTLWENYAPESVEPGKKARPNFVGGTGLSPISTLFEDIIGINVDWPQRKVSWHRFLDTQSHYGVTNYPLGMEGKMDMIGDQNQVVITTDVPFTLHIQDPVQRLQAAIPAGKTVLDLS